MEDKKTKTKILFTSLICLFLVGLPLIVFVSMIFPPRSWAQALLILGPISFVALAIYRAWIIRQKEGKAWYSVFRFLFPIIAFFFLLTLNGALDFRDGEKIQLEVKFQKVIDTGKAKEYLVMAKNNEWFMVRKDEYDLLQKCPQFHLNLRKGLLGIAWREHISPTKDCDILKR